MVPQNMFTNSLKCYNESKCWVKMHDMLEHNILRLTNEKMYFPVKTSTTKW